MAQLRSRDGVDSALIDESGRAAVKWMVAMASGDMTERQLRDFDRWRNADPGNAEAWERMAGGLQPFDTLARAGLPRGSLSRMRPVAAKRDRRTVLAGLAGLLAASGAGTIAAQRFVPLEDLLTDHYTKTAEHDRLRLGDDSAIVLAPRSSINLAMTPEARGLDLVQGRMMLDVANDPRPFTVGLGRVRLDATAGAFVLSRREGRVAVSALRGVATLSNEPGRRLAIRERERLVFDGTDVTRGAVDIEAASSWVSGYAIVRDESVASIVEEIRPYYAGFISLAPDAGTRHATGLFHLFDPVAALSALTQSVGLEMTRTAGVWIRIGTRSA